jgi:TPR repeat protein
MKRFLIFLATLGWLASPALAELGDLLADDGTTNPEEQTLDYFANSYDFGSGKSTACVYGYWATKAGNHAEAKKIFDKCVAAGVDAAYPWQSYMSQNGYATRKSAEDAAAWDRKSAERGYKIGQFNYGISLLRGHGVKQDIAAGRVLIDRSAAQGLDAAHDVIDSGYDPDVGVPDADEPRGY